MEDKNYTKKRIKIFQNGTTIFDRDVWVCMEDSNTYNSLYFYHRDRNMRRIEYKTAFDDADECNIMLGIGDTLVVCEPSSNL